MATTRSNRDVKMTLSVETLGQAEILALKNAVESLAQEGGEAAPEFAALADQIGRLGAQSAALDSFKKIASDTEQLRAAQSAAAQTTQELATRLGELKGRTEEAISAQADVAARLLEARKASIDAAADLRAYSKSATTAEKSTQAYKDEVARLIQAQASAAKSVTELSAEMTRANSAVSKAESEQAKLQKAYDRSAKAAENQAKKLAESEAALAGAAQAAADLGTSTEDLAQSEGELLVALNSVGEEAEEVRQRLADLVTEQERQARATEDTAKAALQAKQAQDALAQSLADELALIQQVTASQDALERALRERAEAERAAAVAAQQAAAAAEEQAEFNRLFAIEQESLNRLRRQGEDALAAETAAIREAEQASNLYIAEKRRQAEAEEAAATAARQAAETIDNAFGTIGVRSAQELQREIDEVRAAMKLLETTGAATGSQLNGAFAAGEARIKALEREMRQLNGTLTLGDRAASLFKNSLGQIAAGNLVADGIASIVERVKELGRQFIATIVSTERLRRSLNAIYKDTELAGRQFDFLNSVANEAGVSVNSLRDSFVRFSASANSAGIEVGLANELFRNLALASASLGLSSEQTSGALDALGQIASKGVVSMEELRQQLGDRLPGAIGITAKGLGIAEDRLIKLVESGQLTADQFFPAFSRGLVQLQGDTDTLSAAWARFTNLLTNAAQSAGDAGFLTLLSGAVRVLGTVLGAVVLTLNSFAEGLFIAGRATLAFYETLMGNGSEAWGFFNEELRKSNERITQQSKNLINFATNTQVASDAVGKTTGAVGANTTAVLANAAAQERAAAGATSSGNAYIQALAKMSQNTAAAEANTQAAEKLAKAKDLEGRASIEAARLSGDAAAELIAATEAASANVAASERVIAARTNEVSLTEKAIAVIQAEGVQRGGLTSAMQAQIDKLTETLTKQQAEVEASRQSTEQLKAQAAAAELLAQVYADNSGSLETYRQQMESLGQASDALKSSIEKEEQALAVLKEAVDRGNFSNAEYQKRLASLEKLKVQYNETNRQAAAAEGLYRDAVEDSAANIKRAADAKAADLQITLASAKAQQSYYERLAQAAEAQGDTAKAIYFAIEAKQREIKTLELSMQIKTLELEAERKALEIQKENLDAADPLYKQKQQELEIRLKLIQAKQIENGATKEAIELVKQEIQNLRFFGNEQGSVTKGTDENTKSREKNADAIRDQAAATEELTKKEAERKRLKVDEQGFSADEQGNRIVMGGDLTTRTGILNFLRGAGVDDEQAARRITEQFTDGRGNVPYFSNPGQTRYGGDTISAALLRAAETYTLGGAGARAKNAEAGSQTPSNRDSSTNKTVTINVGGRSQKVNVNSDADVQALTGILRQLETSANTSA